MKKTHGLLLAFLTILIGGGVLFTRLNGAQRVKATLPHRGHAIEAIYATGTVEATVMLPIAARTSARLITLERDEGDQVVQGQVLARLEDDELRQMTQELIAREDYALKEFNRQKTLLAQKVTTRESFERASSELTAATAARKAAEVRAEYLTLKAPITGTVIRRDGEIGQLIPVNQAVFWLSDQSPLRITAEVDEEDVSKIAPGQEVLIRGDAFPGQTFNGKISSITPMGDSVARSYRVRIGFVGSHPFKIGMTAENNIIVNRTENALLVPSSAVLRDKIWIVEASALSQREIEVGARGIENTEIRRGLDEQSVVVLEPETSFANGDPVRVTMSK
jgi:multidrug efflux system membrane fusion protein